MHKLIIEDDGGETVVFPLVHNEISIGRLESSTIRLTERNVSRRHARLMRRDGRYVLEDLASYVGTRVNGARIESPTALNEGDEVLIGDYHMALAIEEPLTMSSGVLGGPSDPSAPLTAEADQADVQSDGDDDDTAAPIESGGGTGTGEMELLPPDPARLVMLSAPRPGQEFFLRGESTVIGRGYQSDIAINHKSVSGRHAKVIRDGQRYVVVDLQSVSGVLVNGASYRRVELKSGDVVTLGRVRLRFALAGEVVTLETSRPLEWLRGRRLFGAVATAALAAVVVVARKQEAAPPPRPRPAAPLEAIAPSPPVEVIEAPDRPHPPILPVPMFPPRLAEAREITPTIAPEPPRGSRRSSRARRLASSLAHERRRHPVAVSPSASLPGGEALPDIGPPPAPDRPRRRAIDANDPYAKDQP
jgi:pSer/pThr/pTyr-binding forkhead associated (FHA) protein